MKNKDVMKKAAAFLIMAMLAAGLLGGCGQSKDNLLETTTAKEALTESNQTPMARVAAMTGPTAIGMVELMEKAEEDSAAYPYAFHLYGTADEVSMGLIQGTLDMAAVPCNLASVLYNKTQGKIQVAAINTLGVLYLVETGDTIHSVEDLRGKTIYSTGQGTTPEYTLNYLLSSYGMDPEVDVTIEYKSEAAEVAAILAETQDAVAMLPQPYVTAAMTQNEALRIALSVSEEWDKVNEDSSVITGVFVVRRDFAEQNPELVKSFLTEYESSAAYAKEQVEACAQLVEKFGIFKAAIAQKAIPYCNVTFIAGRDMQEKVQGYLTTLYQQNPAAVGGNLPEDGFFYTAE